MASKGQNEYKTLLMSVEDDFETHIQTVMDVIGDKFSTEEIWNVSLEDTDEDKRDALLKILKKRDEAALVEVITCLRENKETDHIVQNMRTKNPSTWFACESRFYLQHHEYPPLDSYKDAPEKINILLVGKTGVGKSSTANMLSNTEHFEESSSSQSVTETTNLERISVGRMELAIIDSPGLFDTSWITSPEQQMRKIVEVALEFQDGIHAFLVIWPAGTRITKEEEDTLKTIEGVLSDVFYRNCVLVLTKALGTFRGQENTLERYVQDERRKQTPIARFVEKVQNRVVAVENKPQFDNFNVNQSQRLLGFIASMLQDIGWEPYDNEVFMKVKKGADEAERKRLEMLEMGENLTAMKSILSSYLLRSYLLTLKSSDLNGLKSHLTENLRTIRQKAKIDSLKGITDENMLTFFARFIFEHKSYISTLKESKKAQEQSELRYAILGNLKTLPNDLDEVLKIERVISRGSGIEELFPDVRSKLIEQGHGAADIGREMIAYFGSNENSFQAHKWEVARNEFKAIISPFLDIHFNDCSDVELEEIERFRLSDGIINSIIQNVRSTNLAEVFTDNKTIIDELHMQLQSSHFGAKVAKRRLMLILEVRREDERKAIEKFRNHIRKIITDIKFKEEVMKHIGESYTLDDTTMLIQSLGENAIPEKMSRYLLTKLGADDAEKAERTFIPNALLETFFNDECRQQISTLRMGMAEEQVTHCILKYIDAMILTCKTAEDCKSLQNSITEGEAKQLITTKLQPDLSSLEKGEINIDPDFVNSEISKCLEGKTESIKESLLQNEALEEAARQLKQQEEFDKVKRKVSDLSKKELPGFLREHCSVVIRFHEGMMQHFKRVPKELYIRVVRDLTEDEEKLLGYENIHDVIHSQMQDQREIIVSCRKSAYMCSVM